jgi:hypothetical protein
VTDAQEGRDAAPRVAYLSSRNMVTMRRLACRGQRFNRGSPLACSACSRSTFLRSERKMMNPSQSDPVVPIACTHVATSPHTAGSVMADSVAGVTAILPGMIGAADPSAQGSQL